MEGDTQRNMDDISEEEKKEVIALKDYIDELSKRQQWREHLRKQNSDLGKRLDESELRRLDSSLKKVLQLGIMQTAGQVPPLSVQVTECD